MRNFRHVVIVACFLSCLVTSMIRMNINVAMISMVGADHKRVFNISNSSNGTIIGGDGTDSDIYEWDQGEQGLILGGVFWTYMLFQIPAGIMIERFGGRTIILFGFLSSGLINLVTPFLTFNLWVFFTSRLMLGAVQAGVFPGSFSMLTRWVHPDERAFAYSTLRVGAIVGSIIASLGSGFICKLYSWPLVFYGSGSITLLVMIGIYFILKNDPLSHPWVDDEEKMYLSSFPRKEMESTPWNQVPWISIITNKSVVASAFFKFSYFVLYFSLSSKLPTFLNDVLKMDITYNGMVNGFFNLTNGIALSGSGILSDRIIQKGFFGIPLTRTLTRKVFGLITGVGSGVIIGFLPFVGTESTAIPYLLILLYLCTFLLGFSSGADVPLPSEMSRNYPASVFVFINCVAMFSGFLAPMVIGVMLRSHSDSIQSWRLVFVSMSALSIFASILFLIFAEAERQPFDMNEGEKQEMTLLRNSSVESK